MRYAIASVFAMLVAGMASAVPNDAAPPAELVAAPQPARCEAIAELSGLSPTEWDRLRAAPRSSATLSAEAVAAVESAVRELVACMNGQPEPQAPWGDESPRAVLVWVGEPWALSDARVAAPLITRSGSGRETWRLSVLEREGGRYRVDDFVDIDPRRSDSLAATARPAT